MPFTNPLVAGNTLIRTAIKSPNYVAGVSGWSINKDGTAEFGNTTVRGTLEADGANGSYVRLKADSFAEPFIGFNSQFSAEKGTIRVASGQMQMFISGTGSLPLITLGGTGASFHAGDIDMYPVDNGNIRLNVAGTTGGNLFVGGPYGIGRGLVARAYSESDGTGFTNVETILLSTVSTTYPANRAYRIEHSARYTNSAATANFPILGFRKTDLAGMVLGDPGRMQLPASTLTFNLQGHLIFTTATDVTAVIVMYGVTQAAPTVTQKGAASLARYFNIYDIGDANDYPGYTTLV